MPLNINANYYLNQRYLEEWSEWPVGRLNKQVWFDRNKNELEADPVFKKILESVGNNIEYIYPGNWKSMCMSDHPNDIRLRPSKTDDFLIKSQTAKLSGNKYIIFSCIKIRGVKTYFVCSSQFFCNYCFSTSSSNSFIRMTMDDLTFWSTQPNQIRNSRKRSVRGRGGQSVYQYWTGNERDTDLSSLDAYINILSQIDQIGYAVLSRRAGSPLARIDIPNSTRELINERYKNICILSKNNTCYWKDATRDIQKRVNKDQHHMVPEEFFIQKGIIDSDLVNNINNIVLLCEKCHNRVHGKDKEMRKFILDNILDVLNQVNIYNDFINYIERIHLTLPLFYRIYGAEYEG